MCIRDRLARRYVRRQPICEVVKAWHVTGSGPLQLLGPATHLPLQETVGVAKVTQSHVGRVDLVQVGQGVDELMCQRRSLAVRQLVGVPAVSYTHLTLPTI